MYVTTSSSRAPPTGSSRRDRGQPRLHPHDLVFAVAHDHAVKSRSVSKYHQQQASNPMLCSSHLLLRAQVNSCLRPPRPTPVPMARSAPTFVAVFLLVLVLLTMDAAQGQQPFPLSTDPSDGIDLSLLLWHLKLCNGDEIVGS